MKRIKIVSSMLLLLSISFLALRCQHDDEEVIPVVGPDPIVRGTEKVSCTDCTPLVSNGASADFNANGVPAGTWYCDKSHSNVNWETAYKTLGSLLTGKFNYFVLDNLTLDEAAPATIAFEGYVRLNTVNTGEPGRDGGCLLGTYGTEAAKTDETENIASLVSLPGTGRYSTTDESYFVDANLSFLGVTKQVTVKLTYANQSDQGTFVMCGITAEFEFLALSDFALSSTNIDDKVVVKINTLLRNKK